MLNRVNSHFERYQGKRKPNTFDTKEGIEYTIGLTMRNVIAVHQKNGFADDTGRSNGSQNYTDYLIWNSMHDIHGG